MRSPSPVKTLKDGPDRASTTPEGRPPEHLPYVVELWSADRTEAVERVLARAGSAKLAHEIFKAASTEYPERRVTVQKDGRVVADTAASLP
jgi:hypothetical protein